MTFLVGWLAWLAGCLAGLAGLLLAGLLACWLAGWSGWDGWMEELLTCTSLEELGGFRHKMLTDIGKSWEIIGKNIVRIMAIFFGGVIYLRILS